jgi:hypothetical protein
MPWVSGTAPATAEVPLLGLSASVVKTDPDAAMTPIVDENRSGPRSKLSEVGVGDKITVTTADGASRDYRVTGRKVVDPHLAETSPGPSDVDATLVTCMPLDPLLNSLSLVIQATKVEPPAKTVPAPDPEQKL